MVQAYSYIRTSGRLQEGASGMNPASQQMQLRKGGRTPGIKSTRDVGTTSTQREGAGANLYGGRFPKAGLAKRQLQ